MDSHQPENDMSEFAVNQIVKGAKAGQFVILAFRTIGGEAYAQVKEYDSVTGKARRGEFALPLSALRA
jgi:hypothetical protein